MYVYYNFFYRLLAAMEMAPLSPSSTLYSKLVPQPASISSLLADFPRHQANPMHGKYCRYCRYSFGYTYILISCFFSDGFAYHNGAAFSTFDQDHANYILGNCATIRQNVNAPGPNWYTECWHQSLMGKQIKYCKFCYVPLTLFKNTFYFALQKVKKYH